MQATSGEWVLVLYNNCNLAQCHTHLWGVVLHVLLHCGEQAPSSLA